MHGDKRYSHEETKKYYPKGALCWFECNQYGEPLGTAIFIETVPRRKLVKERMSDFVNQVLADVKAPFHVNEAKTRYGSRKGSNWNLGVMLNKDNNITVGHMKKKHFKAALCNFICDYQHGKSWNPEEIMTLRGQLSYYRSVEADYFNYVVRHMNEKFHTDVERIMSLSLSPMQYLILHHKAQPGTPAVCDDIQTIVTIQV